MSSETAPTPETIVEQEFYDFLNGVGNHEAKLLVTALMFEDPERWFSGRDLMTNVNRRQQKDVGWQTSDTVALSYCRESLEPIGAVAKGTLTNDRGKIVAAYKAVPEKKKLALSLSGGLLQWSLRFPEFSLQQLLGKTQSTSGIRSPQTRFQIYMELATSSDAVSLPKLARGLGVEESLIKGRTYLQSQLEALKNLGIVSFRSRLKDYDPILEVWSMPKLPDRRVVAHAESQALNSVLNTLELGRQLRRSELINLARSLNPDTDEHLLKTGIAQLAFKKRRIKFVEDDAVIEEHESSAVAITPEYQEAVVELLNTLSDILDGNNLDDYSSFALATLKNPASVSNLMAKARNASSFASRVEDLRSALLGVTHKLGSLTVEAAQEEILKSHGRKVTLSRLRSAFAEMAEVGLIEISKEQTDTNSNRHQNVYRAVETK